MKRACIRLSVILWAVCATSIALAIDTEPAFPDAARQSRYENLTHELRCLVCQNQSVADSNAPLAGDLRRIVRSMIAEGRSDSDVRRFMTERYGDFVLYDPPLSARTYLLWAAPALLVLASLGVAMRVIIRRSQMTDGVDSVNPDA